MVRYKAERFDLVLADIDMKPMDGITLLKQLKLYDPNSVVIIMTAYASTDSAIQALKFGAFDYLPKPFRVDELISTLSAASSFRQMNAERAAQTGLPVVKAGEIEQRLIGQSARARSSSSRSRSSAPPARPSSWSAKRARARVPSRTYSTPWRRVRDRVDPGRLRPQRGTGFS